jgi:hypothetical protein
MKGTDIITETQFAVTNIFMRSISQSEWICIVHCSAHQLLVLKSRDTFIE